MRGSLHAAAGLLFFCREAEVVIDKNGGRLEGWRRDECGERWWEGGGAAKCTGSAEEELDVLSQSIALTLFSAQFPRKNRENSCETSQ